MRDPEVLVEAAIEWIGGLFVVLLMVLGVVVVSSILLAILVAGIQLLLTWPG